MSPIAPLVAIWILGLLLFCLDGRRRPAAALAVIGLGAVLVLDAIALYEVATHGRYEIVSGDWPAGVGIRLRVDMASVVFALISTVPLLAVLVDELGGPVRSRSFPALVLLLGTGLHGAFFTADAFNFYVFFELAVVSSFALAAYGYGRAEIRGAFVYVVVNLIGSVMFLIGVGALYHATGTLDLAQIATRAAASPDAATLPAACVAAALGLKLGLFPFHVWLPVVYSHARPVVAAALAGALANIAAYGLLRFGYDVLPAVRAAAAEGIVVVGGVASIYGGLLALRARHAAEVAAYAAIAHAGNIVLALGVGGTHGLAAVVLLSIAGSIDKSLAFLALEAEGARRWWLGSVVAASLAGMPLTAGFLGKLQLVRAAVLEAGPMTIALVVVIGLLGIAYGARYQLTLLCERAVSPRSGWHGVAAVAIAVVVIAVGVVSAPVVQIAERIAAQLVGVLG